MISYDVRLLGRCVTMFQKGLDGIGGVVEEKIFG